MEYVIVVTPQNQTMLKLFNDFVEDVSVDLGWTAKNFNESGIGRVLHVLDSDGFGDSDASLEEVPVEFTQLPLSTFLARCARIIGRRTEYTGPCIQGKEVRLESYGGKMGLQIGCRTISLDEVKTLVLWLQTTDFAEACGLPSLKGAEWKPAS